MTNEGAIEQQLPPNKKSLLKIDRPLLSNKDRSTFPQPSNQSISFSLLQLIMTGVCPNQGARLHNSIYMYGHHHLINKNREVIWMKIQCYMFQQSQLP